MKDEAKLVYLLECLQKTAPPVLMFAENKRDVDLIHEFLLVMVCAGGGAGGAGLLAACDCLSTSLMSFASQGEGRM